MDKVKRVEFTIDETDALSGVKTISLVDQPAIESDFIFLSKEKPHYVELKGDNYKQVVAGLALIPDKDILRYDAMGEPYFGYFSKATIEAIRNKFHKEQLTANVNTDHNSNDYIDAYLIESYIIDSEEMLAAVKAKGIDGATIGSWLVAYKIESPEIFNKVVSGELNGFSVEIFLQKFQKSKNKIEDKFENIMNKFLEKFKTLLAEIEKEEAPVVEEKKLETAKTSDGKDISYGAVGEAVTIDGQPAPDADYTLDNGKVVTVASGVATDIKDAPAEQKKEEAPVQQSDAELEKVKSDLAKAETDKANLSKEIMALKTEVEKLKKVPLAKPVVKTPEKVIDFSKMSNLEKLAAKNGVTISPAILKRFERK